MANSGPVETPSAWRRLLANVTAFAEAAEVDAIGFLDLRIAHLERRLAQLEALQAASATPAAGN